MAGAAPAPRREIPRDPLEAIGLPPDVRLRGQVLVQVREICGMSLDEIADRTKISKFTLRCIETESFSDLPATVYLRGFLKQIAGLLRLDAQRLVTDYLLGVEAWQAEQARRKPW